jgi:hypothetical protein
MVEFNKQNSIRNQHFGNQDTNIKTDSIFLLSESDNSKVATSYPKIKVLNKTKCLMLCVYEYTKQLIKSILNSTS